MDKAYAAQQAQKSHYEKAIRDQCTAGYGIGPGLAGQIASNAAPPPSPRPGVLAMTENAHAAFHRLSNALSELNDRLIPVTETYPEPGCCEATEDRIEASAVTGLRILVERIDSKTDEIHRLLAALRV